MQFDKFQSRVSQWLKFYSDRTKIKSLLRRLKNIGMVSEKLQRNTLHCPQYFDIFKILPVCEAKKIKETTERL